MKGLTRLPRTAGLDDRETFKQYYCTACTAARNETGRLSLLQLPWEAAFVLLLLDGLSIHGLSPTTGRCSLLSWRAKTLRQLPDGLSAAVQRFVSVAIALSHDDAKRDRDRWLDRVLSHRAYRNACSDPDTSILLQVCLNELMNVTPARRRHESVASVFSILFTHVARYAGISSQHVRAVGSIGYQLGAVTDLVDQLEDRDYTDPREPTFGGRHDTVLELRRCMDALSDAVHGLPLTRGESTAREVLTGIGWFVAKALKAHQSNESNHLAGATT